MINIVLYEPEIPQNTGNIARLCVGLDAILHLIEPLGFKIDNKQVKRAGLDYWQDLKLEIYKNFEEFLNQNSKAQLYFLSTKSSISYSNIIFNPNDFIVFGPESRGLPENLLEKYWPQVYQVPMPGKVRSLNLSNCAAVVAYEAFRQLETQL